MDNNNKPIPLYMILFIIGGVIGCILVLTDTIGSFLAAVIAFGAGILGGIIEVVSADIKKELAEMPSEKKLKRADYVKAFIPTIISAAITLIIALLGWHDWARMAVSAIILCTGVSLFLINRIKGEKAFSSESVISTVTSVVAALVIVIACISFFVTLGKLDKQYDDRCTICRKDATHTFQGSYYCTEHYNNAVKWAIDNN